MRYYAVIPTKNTRPQWLWPLVEALQADGTEVIIVNNGDEITDPDVKPDVLLNIDMPVPNLSRMWNIGLDQAAARAQEAGEPEYIVAVLNDDLAVPAGFVQRLGNAILIGDFAAGFPDQNRVGRYVLPEHGRVPLHLRMCGYAFALRGSANLRADETLQWWYGDDDLDWRARDAGGVVCVNGLQVSHYDANGFTARTPELHEQAGRDRATFQAKWGMTPW